MAVPTYETIDLRVFETEEFNNGELLMWEVGDLLERHPGGAAKENRVWSLFGELMSKGVVSESEIEQLIEEAKREE